MRRIHILYVLQAIAHERFWSVEQFHDWLDQILENSETVPYWVAELASSKNIADYEDITAKAISEKGLLPSIKFHKLTFGLKINKYLSGLMSKQKLKDELFDEVDAGNFWDKEFDSFSAVFDPTNIEDVDLYYYDLDAYARLSRVCIDGLTKILSMNYIQEEWISI